MTATRRDWLGLAVLALPCVLYSMDLTVLNLAVPRLVADLQPSQPQLLWIIDIYGFVLAGALVTMGTLGDRIGRRKLLMIGAGAFGVVSVLASLSTSASMLIATRGLLGLAGATLAPSTLALIHSMFRDPRQRAFAIGVWGASFSVGALLGPLLGGLMLSRFWWGSAFLLGVPVMLVLVVLGPVLLPEVKAERPGRLDLASAALSLVAILAAIYGVKLFAHGGHGAPYLVVGIALAIVFVRRQRALVDPFIDLRMFRVPEFSVGLVTYALGIFVAFGIFVLVTQDLELVHGLTPLVAGMWLLPSSIGFLVGSLVSPLVSRRAPAFVVLAAGLVLAGVGLVVLVEVGGLAGIAVGTLVYSIGLSPVAPLATAMIVGTAPSDRVGAAAALSETGAELGGALGIAILGSFGGWLYRAQPDSVGDSLADAMSRTLPPPILDGARHAFAHAFDVTALVGAGLLMTIAAIVVVAAMTYSAGADRHRLSRCRRGRIAGARSHQAGFARAADRRPQGGTVRGDR